MMEKDTDQVISILQESNSIKQLSKFSLPNLYIASNRHHYISSFSNIKMKTTFAAVLALYAASILGAPTAPTFPSISIQFANDMTGANVDVAVVADGNPNAVATLFAGTSIDNGGEIIATSAQLVNFVQGTSCVIVNFQGTIIANLNTDKTYADLDGNPNAAVPQVVSGDVIVCDV